MTNILLLPQIPVLPTLQMVSGSDFRDGIQLITDATTTPVTTPVIAGIAFVAPIYAVANPLRPLMVPSTANGMLTLDADNGIVYFAVPGSLIRARFTGPAVCEVTAMADGVTLNLCKDYGPLAITIRACLRVPAA